jgi:hypothetical protein
MLVLPSQNTVLQKWTYMNIEHGYKKFISRKKKEDFIEKKLGHSNIGVQVL